MSREKTIYNLKLHETIFIDHNEIEIRRVAGGWLYTYYKETERQNGPSYWVKGHTVFVPFSKEFLNNR